MTGRRVGPVNALSIAGSDPSGGAGVQADLKTFGALGAYGLAVVTALTAQNTRGVRAVHVPPADFLREQLEAVSDDVRIDAVKVGMVADAAVADVVADWLERTRPPVVVLDPVMVATSGDQLLDPDAVRVVRDRLVPLAGLVTPNLPELAVLTGAAEADPVPSWEAAVADAEAFAQRHGVRILVKGGHLTSSGDVPDALVEPDGAVHVVRGERIATSSTHGTGCALSSAVAALRPRRATWLEAVADAKRWLTGALRQADELDVGGLPGREGDGPSHGPVHHFHALWPRTEASPGSGPRGRFCDRAWESISEIRSAIDDLPFLKGLAEGTLDPARFAAYLAQDAIYLQEFARAMSRCAELAPTVAEQVWWTGRARECLEAERALHERALHERTPAEGGAVDRRSADPVTTAYVNHLQAVAGFGGYGRLAAAVLPCFWIYADVGRRLLEAGPGPDHPYREWIELYADPGFARATVELRSLVDDLADRADSREREAMLAAFVTSSRYEWSFWDQAWHGSGWPV